MQTHYSLTDLPKFRRAVITIGSFDGVHLGHRQLLQRIRRMAETRDGESVVITFDPHPRRVLRPNDDSLRLLSTISEKVSLIAEQGIDHLVVVPFDRAFSEQQPAEYLENFLVRHFAPDRIVIGYDHRFGKERRGDVAFLRHFKTDYGYEVVEIAAKEVEAITVSSTKIRRALSEGRVDHARELLGRPYTLSGRVVHGREIGRTIGYPTANLDIDDPLKLVPAPGIYAVRASWDCERGRAGMLYIGERPVLQDGRGLTVELHVFDFAGDLYEREMTVSFEKHLREDAALSDLQALAVQLAQDEAAARRALDEEARSAGDAQAAHPDTAVVILNYNGRPYLERFLPGVRESLTVNCRLIVADNASTDDSLAFLEREYPDIEVIVLTENAGFAGGYNLALRQVEAEVYVLLNSDVEVGPQWLQRVLPHFTDPMVGAVQPKVLAQHTPTHFEYAGACGGYLDILGYPFCRGRIFGHTERDEGQYDCATEIFWATGAAFFVRAATFHVLDGFEPEYFAHAEEIDLCWRMKRAGYKILVEPSATVYHVGGGTLAYDTPRKAYLNFRNTLVTSYKNEANTRLLWWLPVRLLLDGAAAGLFLVQGKWRHIGSILRAHFHFYRHLPMWTYRRSLRSIEIEDARIGPSRAGEGRVSDSVVLHYYLLGQERFSEIVCEQVDVQPAKPS